jgi:hypothetical protein
MPRAGAWARTQSHAGDGTSAGAAWVDGSSAGPGAQASASSGALSSSTGEYEREREKHHRRFLSVGGRGRFP